MTVSIYQQFSDMELQILKVRAERAARVEQNEGHEELLTVLSLQISGERYALPIEFVSSAYEGLSITRVPCVPPGVAGIANIRGRIILVIDMKTLLNIPGAATDSKVFVMLNDGDLDVALLVDSIGDVETLPISSMLPVPANSDLERNGHIRGLFGGSLALLDLASLVNEETFATFSGN